MTYMALNHLSLQCCRKEKSNGQQQKTRTHATSNESIPPLPLPVSIHYNIMSLHSTQDGRDNDLKAATHQPAVQSEIAWIVYGSYRFTQADRSVLLNW